MDNGRGPAQTRRTLNDRTASFEAGGRSRGLARILLSRRMTRSFDGGPNLVEVMRAAELALRAPSAGFSQGVHLLVLTGSDVASFWERSRAGGWFSTRAPGVLEAPHVVLVFGDAQEYVERYSREDKKSLGFDSIDRWDTPYWIVDAAMVAENLLLVAEENGWGALFFGVHGDQGSYYSDLGVPASAHCIGAIALGYRADSDVPTGSPRTKARRPLREILHIGSWNQGMEP